MKAVKILKIIDKRKKTISDLVTREIDLDIILNKNELIKVSSSPSDLSDLVRGFLYARGIINSVSDIKKIEITRRGNSAEARIVIHKKQEKKSARKGRIKPGQQIAIKAKDILMLMNKFQKRSLEFKKTGGVHSAALSVDRKILIFKEDLSRHNVIDKVIGFALRNNIGVHDKIMLFSGRVSSEILQKVVHCGVPVLVSVSAPTDKAIMMAKYFRITLIGFARGKVMNIYSQPQRIMF